jgi:hypothetical protein
MSIRGSGGGLIWGVWVGCMVQFVDLSGFRGAEMGSIRALVLVIYSAG